MLLAVSTWAPTGARADRETLQNMVANFIHIQLITNKTSLHIVTMKATIM
jgi:hypothetical protein